MIRLVLATENKDKVREITSILREALPLEVRTLSDFPGVKLPAESGANYRENAAVKALTVARAAGEMAMGDDSGLEVEALGGAPGLFSARYAGEGASYADNRKKLLDALHNLSAERRKARFICTVAIAWPEGTVRIAEGFCEGIIADCEVGTGGFGYDPLFWIPEYRKSFAQMTSDEKNRVSHRGRAVRAAAEIIRGVAQHG